MLEMQNKAILELFEKSKKGELSEEDLKRASAAVLLKGKGLDKNDNEANPNPGKYGKFVDELETSKDKP